MLPPWVVLPLAGLTLLVTAAHVLALQTSDLPSRRRRLRTAAGVLMMLVTGLLAYALGLGAAVLGALALAGLVMVGGRR